MVENDTEVVRENADKLFGQAFKLLQEGKDLDKALDIFVSLLDLNEDAHNIIYYISGIFEKKGYSALSKILLNEAIKKKPDFVEALNNLGVIHKNKQKIKDGRKNLKDVVEIVANPEYDKRTFQELKQFHKNKSDGEISKIVKKQKSEYLANYGSVYIGTGTSSRALDILNTAIGVDQDNSQAHWNKSLALLEMGNYKDGFIEYDNHERMDRCKERHYSPNGTPLWDGTRGKTVVVTGEQGLGDEIMFASMLPDIMRDCNVILESHPRLMELFRYNFPHITTYGTRKLDTRKGFGLSWPKNHKIDAKIAIGSLGKFYRQKEEDFPKIPYLRAEPKYVEIYKDKLNSLGARRKIGISWRGGTQSTNKNTRKIPMELLLPLLKLDYDFISLQYDKNIDEKVRNFEQAYNVKLNHWSDTLADYDHTAGLLSNLDLVISVPQSVIHLAGAMGVATLQLCPIKALWQMGPYGKNMPWYGSVENIWQTRDGDWEPVIQKAKRFLCS